MLFSSVSPSALLWPLPRSAKQEDESHVLCRSVAVVYSRWILLRRVVLHGCVPAGRPLKTDKEASESMDPCGVRFSTRAGQEAPLTAPSKLAARNSTSRSAPSLGSVPVAVGVQHLPTDLFRPVNQFVPLAFSRKALYAIRLLHPVDW